MCQNCSEIIKYFQRLPISNPMTCNASCSQKKPTAQKPQCNFNLILSMIALDEILTQMLIARKKGVIKDRNLSTLASAFFNAAMQTFKNNGIGTVMSEEKIRNTNGQYMETYRIRLSEGKAKKKARELHRFVKSQLSSALPSSNIKAPAFSSKDNIQKDLFCDPCFGSDFWNGVSYVNYGK